MKRIILFGATGGTGKLVVEQALNAGFQVTVIVRDPFAFTLRHPELNIIKGDVLQPNTFEEAMDGQDVVVSCIGARKRGPTKVYSKGVSNILETMQKKNISRLICLSAIAVVVPPGSSMVMKFVIKNILQRLFGPMYTDMLLMEKILGESNINWTVIRAPWLRNSRYTGKYRISITEHLRNASKISRADLAHYIVKHLTDENIFKTRIEISY
jgi:putative NADH-flavin reductase